MDGRAMGIGAMLFGFGSLAVVAAAIYAAPGLMPVAQLLLGAGGVLFLRGLAVRVPRSVTILLAVGIATFFVGAALLVTRRAFGAGFALTWFSMGWTLLLLGDTLFQAAAGTGLVRAPDKR